MLEQALTMSLGVSSVLLLALTGAMGLARHAATREALRARGAEVLAKRDLDEVRAQAVGLRDELQEAQAAARAGEQQLAQARRQSADQLAAVSADREATREQLQAAVGRVQLLQRDLDVALREGATLSKQVKRTSRLLESLGLDLRDRRDPVHPTERLRSRAELRRLLLSTGADAVALVDARGLSAFAVGRDAGVQRLGVTAALAATVEPHLAAMLCAPVAAMSFGGARFAAHLLRLHGTPYHLALENLADCPLVALRHARWALTGLPVPPSPLAQLPDHVIDLDDTLDPGLSAILSDWAGRWSAHAVTVLGADTRPLAATAAADPGAAMGLRRSLRGLMERTHRDGSRLDGLSVSGSTEAGLTVQALFVTDDLDAPSVVCLAAAPLPDEALDEVRASVRWHLSSTPLARVAS